MPEFGRWKYCAGHFEAGSEPVSFTIMAACLCSWGIGCKIDDARITEVDLADRGEAPWVLDNFEALALVRKLEAELPTLEEAGCKVGIGVATGADNAYIGKFDEVDVEPSRKLPLVMTWDIAGGTIEWRGYGVINPFLDDGKLAPFAKFPKFGRHLDARRDAIARRHCAQKTPANWYRTIDRIYAPHMLLDVFHSSALDQSDCRVPVVRVREVLVRSDRAA